MLEASVSFLIVSFAPGCSISGGFGGVNPELSFTFLAQPTPGFNQRFFADQDGHVLVCDNSGGNPGQTDDGPLWIDSEREAVVYKPSYASDSVALVSLPITFKPDSKGKTSHTTVTLTDLAWLVDNGHYPVSNVRMETEIASMVRLASRFFGKLS